MLVAPVEGHPNPPKLPSRKQAMQLAARLCRGVSRDQGFRAQGTRGLKG